MTGHTTAGALPELPVLSIQEETSWPGKQTWLLATTNQQNQALKNAEVKLKELSSRSNILL